MNKKPIPKQWSSKVDKTKVHPALVEVVTLALDELAAEDVYFKVYSGLRTFSEQDALYAQGRTTSGNVVTKAKGGQSMHNYGLALDLAPYKPGSDSEVYWPEPDKKNPAGCPWYRLEAALEKASRYLDEKARGDGVDGDGLEFEWGGRWRFRDVPHCQVRTTIAELQSGYYPRCADMDWSVRAHLDWLWGGDWMSRRVQCLLGRLGYYPGAVDGDIGPRSNAAMAQFREREKLPREGELFTRVAVEELVRAEHQLADGVGGL